MSDPLKVFMFLAAGQTVQIKGNIAGSARCVAASAIEIDTGKVGQSLTAVTTEFDQSPGSTISRDVVALARNMVLGGTVGRQIVAAGANVTLAGKVGQDVHLWSVGRLFTDSDARIAGNVDYASAHKAHVFPGAAIGGSMSRKPAPVWQSAWVRHPGIGWWGLLFSFAAGAITWGVVGLIFPAVWDTLSRTLRRAPWPALGWGLVALVAVPPLILVLLITIIGLPLALVLLAAYIELLYVAKLIVAARFGWEMPFLRILSFLTGFAALTLLGKIPVAGILVSLALGAVILAACHRRQGPAWPVPPD